MNLTFLYRGILILSMGRWHRILVGLTWLNRPIYCYSSSDPSLFVLTLACSGLKNAHPFLVVQGLISRSACTERLVLEFLYSAFRSSVQPVTSRIGPHNSSITDNIHSWLQVSRIIAHFSSLKGRHFLMINICSSEMPRSVGWYISTFRDILWRVNLYPWRWDRWTSETSVPKY
jgi:hypothetical protein